MIAQLLESKIIDAISASLSGLQASALASRVKVFGAWQKSLADVLKNSETPDYAASVYVAVGTMQRTTYSTPTAAFAGTVALSVRVECDTTGDLLLTVGEAIENLFATWQGDTYQQAFEALDVDGYSVGNISMPGGIVPVVDFQAKTVSVTWPFTISGTQTTV